MRCRWALIVVLIAAGSLVATSPPAASPPPTSFTFSAAGDHGYGPIFNATLTRLASAAADFHLALGDFRYGNVNETTWCGDFKAQVDAVEIVAGNHEVVNASEGDIDLFAAACPYTLTEPLNGTYAREYWFDYPDGAPLARFLLLSPGLNYSIDGSGVYDYSLGTPRYNWTRDAIDGARAAGIPWVVAGMHYQCFSSVSGCPMGLDLWNLLIDRRVDLILQAHAHVYQRSHQLALDGFSCPAMVRNVYNAACVNDDGADGVYPKGYGSVAVIDGTFGAGLAAVNASDLEAPYFTASMGNNTGDSGFGFTRYTITATSIVGETNLSGTFQDAFRIEVPSAPPPPTQVDAALEDPDVNVTWLRSSPESAVDHYEVWRGTAYSPSLAGYLRVSPDIPPATPWWRDGLAMNNTADFFYVVRAVERYGASSVSPGQAAKLARVIPSPGAYLFSSPFTDSTAVEDSFQGIAWDVARTFAVNGSGWAPAYAARPGTPLLLGSETGAWLRMSGAGNLSSAGAVPCSVSIPLHVGWNLVGYPGMNTTTLAASTAGLQGTDSWEGYDGAAGPYALRRLGPTDLLEPLQAYWVHSSVDELWTVVNDADPGCA